MTISSHDVPLADAPISPEEAVQLARVLGGEGTAKDWEWLQEWTLESPEREALVAQLRMARDAFAESELVNATVVARRVDDLIAQQSATTIGRGLDTSARRASSSLEHGARQRVDRSRQSDHRSQSVALAGYRRWLAIGAAAVGCALFAVIGLPLAKRTLGERTPAPPTLQTYATRAAERATLHLPDGSTVLMNAASRVRYASDFGRGSRTIHLEGEALFTVSQHKGAPFVVEAGGVSTRVLGTVFSVRRYTTDATTRMMVAQGKVMAARTVLTSGQAGIGRADGEVAIDRTTDVATALAWTTGQLSLGYVSLHDAIPQLERWYDVRIVLSDAALDQRRIRITLQDETAKQAMALIAEAVGAGVRWQGRTATFTLTTMER